MASDFSESALALGLALPSGAIERFVRFRDLIAAQTGRVNLTSVREPRAIERRHLLESLAFARELDTLGLIPPGARVIDIGSGAGLPGIPLKIAFPALRVTLLESVGKKAAFLRDAVQALALEDIKVVEGRAEEVARQPEHRGSYDLAVARAVAPLNVLVEYALPFLRPGGAFAGTKGSAAARELAEAAPAIERLGGGETLAMPFRPPHGMPQTLIVVRQERLSPHAYPRRAGIPSKRPLL